MPAVCITALPRVAASVGANRIVQGIKIPHPCGRPDADADADRAARRAVVRAALDALGRAVAEPTVLDPSATW